MSPIGIKHEALATIGCCMYCRAPAIGREHAIPRGLNGVYTLEQASCRDCERVTSRLEGELLRGPLLPIRIVLDLYTKDPADRPRSLPGIVRMPDGTSRRLLIPIEAHPTPLALPLLFGPPYLLGETRPMQMRGEQWTRQFTDPSATERYLASLGAVEIQLGSVIDPTPLIRLVAKIAYCFAVAHVGLDGFTELFLPGVAGATTTLESLSPYVGGLPMPAPAEDELHVVTVEISDAGLIVVAVRLLARFGAPTYVAVVGRTAPGGGDRSWRHGVLIEPNHPILGWPIPPNAQHTFEIVSRKEAATRSSG